MFNRQVENQVDNLFASSENISNKLFNYDQINNLPEPVQRYFKYVLENRQHYTSYVQVKHYGTFRLSEGQPWMPIEGKEYFTTGTPGFIWIGKIKSFPLFWMTGIDQYIQGQGSFQIKLLSVFTIGNATKGKELDKGELMRWLAEAPLIPTALLPSVNLQWEQIDSNSAKAIVKDKELTVNVIFHFNEKGEIVQMTADRFRAVDNSYSKDKWVGYYRNYTKMGNMMIPQEIEVAWDLKSGNFSYAKFRIDRIEYNNPLKYRY
jgi:hypothetical protein